MVKATTILTLFLVTILQISALTPHLPHSNLPGKLVRFADLDQCPRLTERNNPKSVTDVRPDDFTVVMAIGDSITAGLLAGQSRSSSNSRQRPFYSKLFDIQEYRGLSYPTGGDPGSITIARILEHYIGHPVTGVSKGQHPPIVCLQGLGAKGCMDRPEEDGLNAGISGSIAAGLVRQVEDYLLPRLKKIGISDEEWKLVNLGIGANDICAFCMSSNVTGYSFHGSSKQFARDIRKAVNLLRAHVPNIIVNIIGLFRVSSIYELTRKDPYCQPPHIPPTIPHLPLECNCALLPGLVGDWTRKRMDELAEAYDEAVLEVVREWEREEDPTFGAIWQPGTVVDLANYPITALSPIDCFHPSQAAHQRLAAGFWNRLVLDLETKYIPIKWEDNVWVRCLEENDRIPIGMVSKFIPV
ncbi:uncharacterized protein L203_103733 [Cryptococcus depauperatus CBS 7841]|uniref:Phospholipase n=1 Tax=Cryptococcus depauperatus CBS 7841 TaxID=1295531 RepID=A0AAJ8JU67_9TREE